MRIITANTNGIRAAARKGFYDWMLRQRADVVCIQETKAQEFQLTEKLYHPPSMHASIVFITNGPNSSDPPIYLNFLDLPMLGRVGQQIF